MNTSWRGRFSHTQLTARESVAPPIEHEEVSLLMPDVAFLLLDHIHVLQKPYVPTAAESMGGELVRRSNGLRPTAAHFVFRNGRLALRSLGDESIRYIDHCSPSQYAVAVYDLLNFHIRKFGPL